ncbi:MAG: DUF3971 domain-containing protein [Hyphomicrobium sp.]|nr:DUF3971 domain-containing protein [Hyphomicrobium sp.]
MLLWISPIVLLSALAVIVMYVRLLQGPVSLKVMAEPIERGISAGLRGLSAKVDDALLRRSPTGAIEFQLVNLRLFEEDGSVVASAPVAAVGMDLARLAMLDVQPTRIELIEPRVSVSYTARDGLALTFKETPLTDGATQPKPEAPSSAPVEPATEPSSPTAVPSVLRQLDLARVVSKYCARARQQLDASASLSQIGFRNAIVDVDYEGQRSSWKVNELSVDLDHKRRRSVISVAALIESERGPWSLSLLTEDSDRTETLTLKASVRDLVPAVLGRAFPNLALLRSLEMPTAVDAAIRFKTSGELNGADIAVEVSRGLVDFGPAMAAPMLIDAGLFNFNYDAATERLTLAPSTARWGESSVSLAGVVLHDAEAGTNSNWAFDIRSVTGSLAAEEFKVAPVKLDNVTVAGRYIPQDNRIEFANVLVEAGGGRMVLTGDVVAGDGATAGARIDGQFGPANANVVKALWPRMMAPRARQWFGDHLTTGILRAGTIRFASGSFAPPGAHKGRKGFPESFSLDLTGETVTLQPVQGGPPLSSAAVAVTVRDQALEITTPDAMLTTGPQEGVSLKEGRFSVGDIDAPIADAELAFKTQAPLGSALKAVQQLQLMRTEGLAVPPDKIQGKLDGEFVIRLPLLPEIEADTVVITGKAKISDVRSTEKIGIINVQSGAVDVVLGANDAAAKGELILNGVLAKLDWRRQRPAGLPAVTSPLTLTATLDNSDRRQLGIDVSDFIDGDVPVTVAIGANDANTSGVKVTADLTPADFSISPLAWKKPRNRPAKMEFDVVAGTVHKTELRNFKVSGDAIAAEGWIGFSADQKLQEFDFPAVSLNTVSRLQISGKRGPRDILDVRATGTTFDGKDFFRSLFTSGASAPQKIAAKKAGVDVTASFDTVLGFSDASLRGFSMRLSKRGDELTALDARGKLEGGKALIAILQTEPNGKRKIIADTTDAGQSLRLVGFYPNMQGGRGRIDLFLDGEDAAQTAGVLIIEDFKVLGDPIVSEVVSSAAGDGPAIGTTTYGQRKVVREVFQFDRMRLPFNVGYGQFAIDDSYLRGPLLGATLRGKVDYTTQKVNLGGTYIPLQGLNNALGGIPVLGQILSGPRGEGIFGITFAVQGSMANPSVVVNPLSLVAPGIFREMFQMTNPNTNVQPRAPSSGDLPVNTRVRSSSSGGAYEAPETVDGWSSDTVVPSKKN